MTSWYALTYYYLIWIYGFRFLSPTVRKKVSPFIAIYLCICSGNSGWLNLALHKANLPSLPQNTALINSLYNRQTTQ